MKLLAIDTVTEMASIALLSGNDLSVDEALVPREHTRVILPMIEKQMALAEISFAQLDAIAFSRGPGSFTGLRICASITQGLALAYDLPVIPVSSLAILAQGSYRLKKHTSVVTCLDARRNEVYWGSFRLDDSGVMSLVGSENVVAPQLVTTIEGESWHGVGSGFKTYERELEENPHVHLASIESEQFPLARDAVVHAQQAWQQNAVVDASLAIPTYLRDNIATPGNQRVT
jgi:tRNA threonylcarbamoyladenosine biosynthesis protein TsaB